MPAMLYGVSSLTWAKEAMIPRLSPAQPAGFFVCAPKSEACGSFLVKVIPSATRGTGSTEVHKEARKGQRSPQISRVTRHARSARNSGSAAVFQMADDPLGARFPRGGATVATTCHCPVQRTPEDVLHSHGGKVSQSIGERVRQFRHLRNRRRRRYTSIQVLRFRTRP